MHIRLLTGAALTAVAATLLAVAAPPSSAQQGVTIAVDTNPAASPANSATSLGSIEACTSVPNAPGRRFDIDVVVDSIPQGRDLAGFNYYIDFDATRFQIVDQDHAFLLNSAPASNLLDLGEGVPDSESPHSVAEADFGTAEQGPVAGVLGRYTLEVVGTAQGGLAQFAFSTSSDYIFDSQGQGIPVDRVASGFIALGEACPAQLPLPSPTASGTTPDETPQAGETPGAGQSPAASATAGSPTASGSPGAGPSATPGPGSQSSGSDNSGGSPWPYVAGGVAAAAAVLAAAGYVFWRRRSAP